MDSTQPKDPQKPHGPIKAGKLIITIDTDLCIGAATCMAIAPKAYALDSQAKAIVITSADNELAENVIEAAKGCPTNAITITDEHGKQIFPK